MTGSRDLLAGSAIAAPGVRIYNPAPAALAGAGAGDVRSRAATNFRALPARPWQERAGFEGRAGVLQCVGDAPLLQHPFPETLPARGTGGSAPGGREAHRPKAPALDSITSNVSIDPEARKRLRLQHRYRRAAGELIGGRVGQCARHAASFFVGLHAQQGKSAYVSGVRTCGRVWHCPLCASRISEGRRGDIEAVLAAHFATGGRAFMATLTIPHHRFDKLPELLKGVSTAWRYTKQGRGWVEVRGNSGWLGDIRALEVTHGENGWHPHLHVLILFKPGARLAAAEAFSYWLFDAWQRAIERLTGKRCTEKAFAWESVDAITGAAKYLAKWGPSLELTKANTKQGKRGGRSPFQLLRDYADHGDVEAGELFQQFARAFRGARQLTWARGLRKLYLPEPEASDEELAQREVARPQEAAPRIAAMTAGLYRQVTRRGAETEMKIALQDGGFQAVCELLTTLQIPWRQSVGPGDERGTYVPLLASPGPPGGTPREPPGATSPTGENKGFSSRGAPENRSDLYERPSP